MRAEFARNPMLDSSTQAVFDGPHGVHLQCGLIIKTLEYVDTLPKPHYLTSNHDRLGGPAILGYMHSCIGDMNAQLEHSITVLGPSADERSLSRLAQLQFEPMPSAADAMTLPPLDTVAPLTMDKSLMQAVQRLSSKSKEIHEEPLAKLQAVSGSKSQVASGSGSETVAKQRPAPQIKTAITPTLANVNPGPHSAPVQHSPPELLPPNTKRPKPPMDLDPESENDDEEPAPSPPVKLKSVTSRKPQPVDISAEVIEILEEDEASNSDVDLIATGLSKKKGKAAQKQPARGRSSSRKKGPKSIPDVQMGDPEDDVGINTRAKSKSRTQSVSRQSDAGDSSITTPDAAPMLWEVVKNKSLGLSGLSCSSTTSPASPVTALPADRLAGLPPNLRDTNEGVLRGVKAAGSKSKSKAK
ncbi:hypothetical protein FRC12_018358 [Ceratobasidium sp. 428]|nr:hypothetical protein FRC12_018358 [Ceratobasidium sp. 428]